MRPPTDAGLKYASPSRFDHGDSLDTVIASLHQRDQALLCLLEACNGNTNVGRPANNTTPTRASTENAHTPRLSRRRTTTTSPSSGASPTGPCTCSRRTGPSVPTLGVNAGDAASTGTGRSTAKSTYASPVDAPAQDTLLANAHSRLRFAATTVVSRALGTFATRARFPPEPLTPTNPKARTHRTRRWTTTPTTGMRTWVSMSKPKSVT